MITSSLIVKLLKQKHILDLCFPECKVGPTYGVNTHPIRLDFVAIKKSWTQSYIYGYEIKTHRQDFVNDNKWPEYLKYCTSFYFVCPPGVINKTELPDSAGLYNTSKNGTRLFCIKKAPIRDITIPESFFWYLLINRVIASENTWKQQETNYEYWKRWLSEKDEKKNLGSFVSKKLRKLVDDKISCVEKENRHFKDMIQGFDTLKQFLLSIGVSQYDIDNGSSWTLRRRVNDIRQLISPDLLHNINTSINELDKLKQLIIELTKEKNENI